MKVEKLTDEQGFCKCTEGTCKLKGLPFKSMQKEPQHCGNEPVNTDKAAGKC